jgi:sodium-dependent dicarboxylate transporter 2/3/5
MSTELAPSDSLPSWGLAARIGLFAGPIAAVLVYLCLPHSHDLLTHAGKATAAIGVLMAIWWMTEAVPLEATSLLPLVLLPLCGVYTSGKESAFQRAATPYASSSIFLFLGGFLIALAVERWGLHRRVALMTVYAVGTKPTRIVGGFMLATAFISLWISNTATTLLMLPIGLSVVQLLMRQSTETSVDGAGVPSQAAKNFATSLMLGIAYASSIGGLGTLIGTPPNVFFAGFMEEHGIQIGFGRWMAFAVPLVVVYLAICWWLLVAVLFPMQSAEMTGGRTLVRSELVALGPVSRGELIVLIVFLCTATAWIARDWVVKWDALVAWFPVIQSVDDALIAMVGAIALFLIPVDPRRGVFALDWHTAKRLPWGVLLLFGGGLSLAAAMTDSGLAKWIGEQMGGLDRVPVPVLIVLVTAGVILFSELASNLATAATLLPLLYETARAMDVDPLLLTVPAIVGASCGFMLPVATPPNAIAFGTGYISMRQMMRAGFWLDLVAVVLVPIFVYLLGGLTLGMKW